MRDPDPGDLLPSLLPALALLALPVFLIFGPVLVALSSATHHGDQDGIAMMAMITIAIPAAIAILKVRPPQGGFSPCVFII